MSIKDHVKGTVRFLYAENGALWYVTESGVKFPVPFSEVGTATFQAEDKGIFFMRWIRKVTDFEHVDLVPETKDVTFLYARDGALWYRTPSRFQFPVTFEEVTTQLPAGADEAFFAPWIAAYSYEIAEVDGASIN